MSIILAHRRVVRLKPEPGRYSSNRVQTSRQQPPVQLRWSILQSRISVAERQRSGGRSWWSATSGSARARQGPGPCIRWMHTVLQCYDTLLTMLLSMDTALRLRTVKDMRELPLYFSICLSCHVLPSTMGARCTFYRLLIGQPARVDGRLGLIKQIGIMKRNLAVFPQPRPIPDEQKGDGDECDGAKANDGIAPGDAEVFKHWVDGDRHGGAKHGADKVVGCEGRGGIARVGYGMGSAQGRGKGKEKGIGSILTIGQVCQEGEEAIPSD